MASKSTPKTFKIHSLDPASSNAAVAVLQRALSAETALDEETVKKVLAVLNDVLPEIATQAAGVFLPGGGVLKPPEGEGAHTCTDGHHVCAPFDSDTGAPECPNESSCNAEACDLFSCTDGHTCEGQGCSAEGCDDGHTCNDHNHIIDVFSSSAWRTARARLDAIAADPASGQKVSLTITPRRMQT